MNGRHPAETQASGRRASKPSSARHATPRLVCALLGLLLLSAGCSGHAARTQTARDALDKGNAKQALALYNKELDVKSAKDLPAEVSGDNALLLLDRGLVLQQLEDYDNSSRDLERADKEVEMLDFSRTAVDEIGKYLYSDDTGPYKAPPYEKLLVNTMNMVNYLAKADLNGARVEARRFSVMQKYLTENKSKSAALLGGGSYLAGFVFEKSGNVPEAMLYYDEALQYGDFESLHAPIVALAARSSYRTKRLDKIIEAQTAAPPTASPDEAAEGDAQPEKPGEVLVVVNYGRVPAKIARRIPIGLALTYAADGISPGDRSKANMLKAQGLVTWVNFPELDKAGNYSPAQVKVDGTRPPIDIISIDKHVADAWKDVRGVVIASAITRAIARAAVGEVTRQASNDSPLGLVLSLGAQLTLAAADTPDTRSWATLPGRMALARVSLPPGEHTVVIESRGERKETKVSLKPGGFAVVTLTVLR